MTAAVEMRLPRRPTKESVELLAMTEQKNQIPLTPFAKGGNDSRFSIFILIWYCESSMMVYPENLYAGMINQALQKN
jgi:hypothetical protein